MSSSRRIPSLRNNNVTENENREVPHSVNMVMSLEELRDIIVAQVITYENDLKGNREKDIRSLRLISKDWLTSVSKLLYKNGIPLILFNFDPNQTQKAIQRFVSENRHALALGSMSLPFNFNESNSADKTAIAKQNAKTLQKFVNHFRSYFSANNKNAPTYSLELDSSFLQARNFKTLENCLVCCGKGLAELKMELTRDSQIPRKLSKFNLPTLKKLWFDIPIFWNFDSSSRSESEMTCKANTTNLLKHLIEAGSSLEELTLMNSVGLESYLLPATLSTLRIMSFSVKDVEILSRNLLPNLSTVYLDIRKTPDVSDKLFNMLDNWRKTLKIFNFELSCDNHTQSIQVRWPIMENLTKLVFSGHNCELNQVDSSLESCLPKLKELDLSITESGFQTWCANSVFCLVEKLKIALNGNLQLEHIAINLQNIKLTNTTFPNVTSLKLTVLANETLVLHYIFKKMLRLTELNINVVDTRSIRNTTFWDALLTGVTTETAEDLKSSLDNPDGVDIEIIENPSTPSIRRLRNLTTLSLTHYGDRDDFEGAEPIISEVPFIHAFFKMPKLDTLTLLGRFMISDQMQKSLKPKQPEQFTLY